MGLPTPDMDLPQAYDTIEQQLILIIFIRTQAKKTMKKVTGIGGIFFKCKDPAKMKDWYQKHLGFDISPYGVKFEADSTKKEYTLWSPFEESTNYFEPSSKDFMINYRVDNLEALVVELKKEGVTVLDELVASEYGKFIHILDVEGNKVELWEE